MFHVLSNSEYQTLHFGTFTSFATASAMADAVNVSHRRQPARVYDDLTLTVLNIGLERNGVPYSYQDALAAVYANIAPLVRVAWRIEMAHQGRVQEDTVIVHLDHALASEVVDDIRDALGQDAIAYTVHGVGYMSAKPHVKPEWAAFNPSFFIAE